MKLLSHVQLLATPWSAAYQAPPSMGFSRPEYWSGVSRQTLDYVMQDLDPLPEIKLSPSALEAQSLSQPLGKSQHT